MSFLKLKIDELQKSTAKSSDAKNLKQEVINTIPSFQEIANDIFKNASIFVYKQKDSKIPLFWTFNECPYLYNHIPKKDKEEQNKQKDEKKGKKDKKDFTKETTICPHLILVLEYPELIPCVYVDEKGVEKIIKGAPAMAPGIKGFERPFQKGDVVAVRLLEEEDAFAVGVALISSQQL